MREKGNHFENIALRHLKRQGLTFVDRNVYSRRGEIDLLMSDRETLIFVEVRYRASRSHGSAKESITHRKRQRIVRSAQDYLQKKQLWFLNIRFDIVAIDASPRNPFKPYDIEWIPAAFQL